MLLQLTVTEIRDHIVVLRIEAQVHPIPSRLGGLGSVVGIPSVGLGQPENDFLDVLYAILCNFAFCACFSAHWKLVVGDNNFKTQKT